jgi:heme-degrading monooxygenase HmoA
MYARVSRVQAPPDKVDDLIKHFTGSALPALRKMSGYAGHSLGVDRDSGDCQAVTFWDSREALDGSEEGAKQVRTETTDAGGGKVTSVDRFEQVMMERAGPASAPAFVRVNRGKVDPDRIDDLARNMKEEALPAVRSQPGFRALVLGADRDSGKFMITSVWGTADQREASLSAIADIRKRAFESVGAPEPELSTYEVASVEFVGAGALSS